MVFFVNGFVGGLCLFEVVLVIVFLVEYNVFYLIVLCLSVIFKIGVFSMV